MPGENSISFKIYIAEGNENVEVRRFEVDQGVVTNYDYVRERLQYAFPRLRSKAFKLLWKDSEGDEVTISSDEEMMIALSELETDLCKLIVRLPSERSSIDEDVLASSMSFATCCPAFSETQGNNPTCNSCKKPIEGFRYKCLECMHYYQCSDCEHQAHHPDHVMLRLNQGHPTLTSLIPKGIHILRQHLARGSKCAGMASFLHSESFHNNESSKDKCGGHHRRRFRRHSRHGEKSEKNQSEPNMECPFNPNMFGTVENAVGSFMNMFKNMGQQQQQQHEMDTEDSSAQEDNPNEIPNDGPPEPAHVGRRTEEKKEDEAKTPSSSKPQPPNPKIATALKLLAEMGFNDDGKWLSSLLERFDGDISKALDYLMQNK